MNVDIELTKREIELQAEINKGMTVIDKFVNNMTLDEKKTSEFIGQFFIRMHRTLQQSLICVIYHTIQYLADYHEKNPNYHDARNEYAVKWIQDVAKNKTYFPFI